MDFQPQIKYILPAGVPIPFFMSKEWTAQNPDLLDDFEYLQRTYPTMIGKYRKRVDEILDAMDYEGSMIYDEYPDKLSVMRLGDAVACILEREFLSNSAGQGVTEPEGMSGVESAYLRGLAQVLVCNEIFCRRHRGKKGGLAECGILGWNALRENDTFD